MIISNIYKFNLIIICFAISGVATSYVNAATLNAEKQLLSIAAKKNCRIIKTAQHKEDSAVRLETEQVIVTWCTTSPPGEKEALYHILIAVKNTQHDWIDCPGLIPIAATHTPPFVGISQARLNGKTENLDKFTYLSDDLNNSSSASGITGPESEVADGDGLNIGHWDAMQTLYCYNEKWLISEFH